MRRVKLGNLLCGHHKLAEFVVGGGVGNLSRIGRPVVTEFQCVEVCKLLRLARAIDWQCVNLFAAALVGNIGKHFAVRRIADRSIARWPFGNLLEVALFYGCCKDFTMN